MSKIKVSIIVPIYKVEQYLARCLESLVNQTLQDIEIICVDDCSPDGCQQIVKEYMANDPRITLIVNEINIGLGLTRNKGLECANGKYVGFVDSDDYIAKDMYEKLFEVAEKNCAEVVDSNFIEVYDSKEMMVCGGCTDISLFSSKMHEDSVTALLLHSVNNYNISVCTKLYLNSFLRSNLIVFESERSILAEDLVFNLKVLIYTQRISSVANCFYFYCIRKGSLIQSYRIDMIVKVLDLHNYTLKMFADSNLREKYSLDINRGLLRMVYLCLNNELNSNFSFLLKLKRMYEIARNKDVIKYCKNIGYSQMPHSNKVLVNLFRYIVLFLIKR